MTSAGPLDLLLATGGTGGHIYPALAVARVARERGLSVLFLGQRGGMEERLVPDAGFPFHGVAAGKWDRQRPDPRQALRALSGLTAAWTLVRDRQPRLVLGFGGFASFPGCVAAVLTGTPLVLHEGNGFPSRVNRWFAPRARLVVVAQAQAALHLRARATTTVPFPVREVRVDRAEARRTLELPQDATVTLVMGGSQGSETLNREVPAAYRRLDMEEHQVVHSSGPGWFDTLRQRVADLPGYHVHPYLDAAVAFGAADLAITRAGVGTLSEAAFHGVPLVMIPLPTSAEDHQHHNAAAVEAAGAGLEVREDAIERLEEAWRSLLDPDRRSSAAAAARARTPAGAAGAILDTVLPYLRGRASGPAATRGGVL